MSDLAARLTNLSQACWERGRLLPSLAMKKLLESPAEAYHDWNSSLQGYEPPHPDLGQPFESADDMRQTVTRAKAIRERLRGEMIALQEEMDWLVYAAYELLPEDSPAVRSQNEARGEPPALQMDQLDQAQRPFRLWAAADGNYDQAEAIIPSDWPAKRKQLWQARLAAIRDNEHVRRIEQPVYKRRWDEQWKVGGKWMAGELAYEAELKAAYEWWMREEAEWWLEHEANAGPVALDEWAAALWQDNRVRAATEAVCGIETIKGTKDTKAEKRTEGQPMLLARVDAPAPAAFVKLFKKIVDAETVPEGIPFAVPWDELAKQMKFPAKVRKIRGKLNVPRERFHLRGKDEYLWAGLLWAR